MRLRRTCSRSAVVVSTSPRRALSPRPKALLVMLHDLPGKFEVTRCPSAFRVVKQDRFSITRRFGQPDVSGNQRVEDLVAEKILQVVPDLVREVCPLVEHGQEDPFHGEPRVVRAADPKQRVKELGNALQGEVLAGSLGKPSPAVVLA